MKNSTRITFTLREKATKGFTTEPAHVYNLCKDMAELDQEHIVLLSVNKKNAVISKDVIFIGTNDSCLVHPREIYIRALEHKANSIILVHNHPSGDPEPSPEDLRITREIIKAGKVLDMPLLDHVVIGDGEKHNGAYFSIRESGLVDFEL